MIRSDIRDLVELDADHPGFRDFEYRARRNLIAQIALNYHKLGDPSVPVPDVPYTEAEHGVWNTVWQSLQPLHAGYACNAYLECTRQLIFDQTKIPQLAEVNRRLEPQQGFKMLPVAGLISARTFLANLANKIFLSTQYIRHASVPLYTPEPDIVHELVGHAATLADPLLVKLNVAFGEAAKRASEENLIILERVYWYTLEYGLVQENNQVKAYGAGVLSSVGELERVRDRIPVFLPFDIGEIAKVHYDPTQYQPALFVAPNFQTLTDELMRWLDTI